MNSEDSSHAKRHYVMGFASAILTITGVALLLEAVMWFLERPQPEAFFEYLTSPVFSFADLFTGLVVLLLLAAVLLAPGVMPRR